MKSSLLPVSLISIVALGAVGLAVAAQANAPSDEAFPVPSASSGVGVLSNGSAWVVVGDSIEFCYVNASNVPTCQAARRYRAN